MSLDRDQHLQAALNHLENANCLDIIEKALDAYWFMNLDTAEQSKNADLITWIRNKIITHNMSRQK